jgi:hypothetical protein
VVFNDYIKDDCISKGCGQVASGSASLPDPVVLETEERMLERQQNEHDALDAPGEYKYDAGLSVEDVPLIVNIKTLKGRLIAHKFNVLQVSKSNQERLRGRQALDTSCCC